MSIQNKTWKKSRPFTFWNFSSPAHETVSNITLYLHQDFSISFDGKGIKIDSFVKSLNGSMTSGFDSALTRSKVTVAKEYQDDTVQSLIFCVNGRKGIYSDKSENLIRIAILNPELFETEDTEEENAKLEKIDYQYGRRKFDCIQLKKHSSDKLEVLGFLNGVQTYAGEYSSTLK
jgi:hypothetical protein